MFCSSSLADVRQTMSATGVNSTKFYSGFTPKSKHALSPAYELEHVEKNKKM